MIGGNQMELYWKYRFRVAYESDAASNKNAKLPSVLHEKDWVLEV